MALFSSPTRAHEGDAGRGGRFTPLPVGEMGADGQPAGSAAITDKQIELVQIHQSRPGVLGNRNFQRSGRNALAIAQTANS